jgi:hypothetical protein
VLSNVNHVAFFFCSMVFSYLSIDAMKRIMAYANGPHEQRNSANYFADFFCADVWLNNGCL